MARKKQNFRKLEYLLRDEDTIEFNKYYIKHSKSGRKVVWQQRMMIPAVIVGYVILMAIFKYNSKPVYFFGGVMVLAAIVYGFMAEKIVLNQQAKKIRDESNYWENIHREKTTLEFLDDQVDACYKGQKESFGYDTINKVSLTDKAIYIWLDEMVALQVPNSAFEIDSNKDALFNFLSEKCVNAEIDTALK